MEWQFAQVSSALGIRIRGANLRKPLTAGQKIKIRHLLDEHHLILFEEQDISPEEQVRVLEIFGSVSDEKGDGVYHTFAQKNGLFGEWPLKFHHDYGSFQPKMIPVMSLYGVEIAESSMPTIFANLARAYAMLPKGIRAGLGRLTAMHANDLTTIPADEGYNNRCRLLDFATIPPESTHPRMSHPVRRIHPRSGRPLLFVNEMHTSHIEGMDKEKSEELLQGLFSELYSPRNTYAHPWKRHDLVIWDNLALQHGRRPVIGKMGQTHRTLRRVVVCDQSAKQVFANMCRTSDNPKGFIPSAARERMDFRVRA